MSNFPLTAMYCEYLMYRDLYTINKWSDRQKLWELIKPSRQRETERLIKYIEAGYRLALVTPDFSSYRYRLDNIFNAYSKLKKTDCISITKSEDYKKVMGLNREKLIMVILPNAREIHNLMDHASWMENAGWKVIYEVTS